MEAFDNTAKLAEVKVQPFGSGSTKVAQKGLQGLPVRLQLVNNKSNIRSSPAGDEICQCDETGILSGAR